MLFLKDIFKSFGYAFRGIKYAVCGELNMKIHIFVAIGVIVAGFLFHISFLEWTAVIICIGMVFSAEIFNTAIESLVDYISFEKHPMAGKIKDLAAAAVVVCAVCSAIIGCLIFIPKFFPV